MRYGTIPIVRETGGLKDTITCFDPKTKQGNCFCFATYNAHDMLFTIQQAVSLYTETPELFQDLVNEAFNTHSDWKLSADSYFAQYKKLIGE